MVNPPEELATKLWLGHPAPTIPATHHLGHPERAVDYFNQSLLEDPTRSDEDEVTPAPLG
jgi:hypothetical protein